MNEHCQVIFLQLVYTVVRNIDYQRNITVANHTLSPNDWQKGTIFYGLSRILHLHRDVAFKCLICVRKFSKSSRPLHACSSFLGAQLSSLHTKHFLCTWSASDPVDEVKTDVVDCMSIRNFQKLGKQWGPGASYLSNKGLNELSYIGDGKRCKWYYFHRYLPL